MRTQTRKEMQRERPEWCGVNHTVHTNYGRANSAYLHVRFNILALVQISVDALSLAREKFVTLHK